MIEPNALLIGYLAVFLLSSVLELFLEKRNADYAGKQGTGVPKPFRQFIDEGEFQKAIRYTRDKAWFSMIDGAAGKLVFLVVILSGVLPWVVQQLKGWHMIPAGLLFFAVPWLLSVLADLPFDYYRSFVIEERYGFNTRTRRIWVTDLLKGLVLSMLIGSVLLTTLFVLVLYGGEQWWIWACGIFLAFQLVLTILYPTLIAPLFNTFSPVGDVRLVEEIKDLVEGQGLGVEGVFQMDASRRSRHTNAYFSGLGRTKRIVLFDTLLQSHTQDEIMGVLAHELGHYKRGHRWKQFALVGGVSAVLFFLASKMIAWEPMYGAFGFDGVTVYAGFFLVGVLWEPAGFFLSPLGAALSRRFERQADSFAARVLGSPRSLVNALKKMAKDNLTNLCPHPIYVWFTYSHPPLLERVTYLEQAGEG
jgi:STE24 endopeptidase